jgi:hypothetical protein
MLPDADLYLDSNVRDDKPEMAAAVARIFAVWASIEHRLDFLLIEIVGSDSSAAIAIYETLTAQHLQRKALENAAKAVLPLESYSVLITAISMAEGSQTPRNHLAHWMWGGCRQRPDLLALADPVLQKELDLRIRVFNEAGGLVDCDGWDPDFMDPNFVLAYSIDDLNRAHRDLIATNKCLGLVGSYLFASGSNPRHERYADEQVRILAELNASPLFREAKGRIDADLQKRPPKQDAPLRSRWFR